MKIKIIVRNAKVCVIILLFVSFRFATAESVADNTATKFRPVSPNDITDILTRISDKTRSNYERIKTWQGEADATVEIIYRGPAAERVFRENTSGKGKIPKGVRQRTVGNIRFAADFEKGLVYQNLHRPNPLQYTELETERDLGAKSLFPLHTVSVITPEHFTKSGANVYEGISVKSRSAVREAPEKCSCAMSGVFDPRKCFGLGGPLWQILSLVIQNIDEDGKLSEGAYDLELEERVREGSTEYRIGLLYKSPEETYAILTTMVFSGEKGFNIISYQVADQQGKLLEKESWDYGLLDGIYLPTKTGKQNFERQTGQLSYQEEFIFKNSQINHVITPETFTYKNLGLKNGDKFINKILDMEYTYQDGELILTSNNK